MGAINFSLQTITSGSMFRPGEYVWFGQPNQIPDPDNPATLKNPYIDAELTTTANAIQGIDSDSKCEQSTDGRLYGSGTYSIRVMSKADNTGVQRYYLPEVDLTLSADEVLDAIRELSVGTVSESGGVVTGDIIERGSNANGEYVKYADGTLICTTTEATATATAGPSGGYYYHRLYQPYPVVFASRPDFFLMPIYATFNPGMSHRVAHFHEKPQDISPTTSAQLTFTSTTSGDYLSFKLLVVGRWY